MEVEPGARPYQGSLWALRLAGAVSIKFRCCCNAGESELNIFQIEDGQVVAVGGRDDQGVLDSVELINLTSSEVGACLIF